MHQLSSGQWEQIIYSIRKHDRNMTLVIIRAITLLCLLKDDCYGNDRTTQLTGLN